MLRALRSWMAGVLGIKNESAKNGDWWETDFILVLISGSFLAAILGWLYY